MGGFNYTYNSKKGLARDKNQDRILILDQEKYFLFALFDGVSSMPHSYLFAENIINKIRFNQPKINETGDNLDNILYDVNNELLNSGIKGGCTASILFCSKYSDIVKFINLGDTRIYAFTNQFLESITIDDSLIGQENVITRYLGKPDLKLDDFKTTLFNHSYNFLLCTDGFYKLMEANLREYFKVINFKNMVNIKRKFAYLQRGKNQDDSSYILIKHEI